jgi:hypothetical protein
MCLPPSYPVNRYEPIRSSAVSLALALLVGRCDRGLGSDYRWRRLLALSRYQESGSDTYHDGALCADLGRGGPTESMKYSCRTLPTHANSSVRVNARKPRCTCGILSSGELSWVSEFRGAMPSPYHTSHGELPFSGPEGRHSPSRWCKPPDGIANRKAGPEGRHRCCCRIVSALQA